MRCPGESAPAGHTVTNVFFVGFTPATLSSTAATPDDEIPALPAMTTLVVPPAPSALPPRARGVEHAGGLDADEATVGMLAMAAADVDALAACCTVADAVSDTDADADTLCDDCSACVDFDDRVAAAAASIGTALQTSAADTPIAASRRHRAPLVSPSCPLPDRIVMVLPIRATRTVWAGWQPTVRPASDGPTTGPVGSGAHVAWWDERIHVRPTPRRFPRPSFRLAVESSPAARDGRLEIRAPAPAGLTFLQPQELRVRFSW